MAHIWGTIQNNREVLGIFDDFSQPLLETKIFQCARNRQGYIGKPSGILILAAGRQGNPDRDKMIEKL